MLVSAGMSLERAGWFSRVDVTGALQAGFVEHATARCTVAASNVTLPRQY